RFASLKISIWPEFDKPSVLVMLDGVLADASNLPRPISILIPADAQLFVTTWENPDGSLAPEQPAQQTKQDDGYTRVTFTTAQPKFRVEYYHDAARGTPDKTINFAYKSIGVIDAVTLEIQQPLKASNFAVTPAPQTMRTDSDGFKYFVQTYSNAVAEQTLTAQIKYTKTDPNPSVSAQPAPAPVAASESNNWFLLIALVALGLAVLLGFILLQQRALATRPAAPTGSKNRKRGKHRAGAAAAIFCTQCGRALGANENFCPQCGAKRRAQG
ncbi:MAG: zinc-ribbon domain-containing protein, partial [Anaerolineales bacterium]|nr:zinc-ribbon domain-containing protein [Anaerolineales bacterium]